MKIIDRTEPKEYFADFLKRKGLDLMVPRSDQVSGFDIYNGDKFWNSEIIGWIGFTSTQVRLYNGNFEEMMRLLCEEYEKLYGIETSLYRDYEVEK